MTTVLITGASGHVGNRLAGFLDAMGCVVVGVSRNLRVIRHCGVSYCRTFSQPLGSIFSENSIDVVVHCAHDLSPNGSALTETGTLQWANESLAQRAVRQIFISSISSRADAHAAYGRVKYSLEQWFLDHGATVLRLGLVIGNGGLFGRMVRFVQDLRFMPLIGGGRAKVYFNGIDWVTEQIVKTVIHSPGSVIRCLHQPEPTTMRALLETVREVLGKRSCFVSIPYLPCLAAAWIMHKLRLNAIGISYENLVGLRQNDVSGIRSDFLDLGGQAEDVRTLVERAIARGAEQRDAASMTRRSAYQLPLASNASESLKSLT
jgi:nucleoside-diphosphate-sugar epimerase